MVDMHWQVQQVKQRLSEVLRAAETDGPQFVTRHGQEVAVVMSIQDYHEVRGARPRYRSLSEALLDMPKLDLTGDEIDELFGRDRTPDTSEVPFSGPGWE